MHHEGILVFIFLALVLLFPIAIFVRVYGVTYSGLRSSGHSSKPPVQQDDTENPQQVTEKQAEQAEGTEKTD